jgi:hypothetical protein
VTRLPKEREVWTNGRASTTVLAVYGVQVARTAVADPDVMIVEDLDAFLRGFTPPTAPVPEWAPKVLYIYGVEWSDGDAAHDDPACHGGTPCLRYVLDPVDPWEVEPS